MLFRHHSGIVPSSVPIAVHIAADGCLLAEGFALPRPCCTNRRAFCRHSWRSRQAVSGWHAAVGFMMHCMKSEGGIPAHVRVRSLRSSFAVAADGRMAGWVIAGDP